jgi:hypothetical protein
VRLWERLMTFFGRKPGTEDERVEVETRIARVQARLAEIEARKRRVTLEYDAMRRK